MACLISEPSDDSPMYRVTAGSRRRVVVSPDRVGDVCDSLPDGTLVVVTGSKPFSFVFDRKAAEAQTLAIMVWAYKRRRRAGRWSDRDARLLAKVRGRLTALRAMRRPDLPALSSARERRPAARRSRTCAPGGSADPPDEPDPPVGRAAQRGRRMVRGARA